MFEPNKSIFKRKYLIELTKEIDESKFREIIQIYIYLCVYCLSLIGSTSALIHLRLSLYLNINNFIMVEFCSI